MTKKVESATQKKIDKVSAQVVRDANNRILSAGAGTMLAESPIGRRFFVKQANGRYLDIINAPDPRPGLDINPMIHIDVTRVGRYSQLFSEPRSAVSIRSGTVISKDSVQRAAKSAMSQFRSKKK